MLMIRPSRLVVHTRHNKKRRLGMVAGLITGLILAFIGTGYWMAQNARQTTNLVNQVERTLHNDKKIGVPPSQIMGVDQQLSQVHHQSFVFVPLRFFGTLFDVPQKLHALQTQASALPAQDARNARRLAISWGQKLIKEQGVYASMNTSQLSQKVAHLSRLGQLLSQIKSWETQYNTWHHALEHLASLGGGLNHDQPNHVLSAVESLNTRLKSRGEYWQGVKSAESTLSQSQHYLHENPLQELAHYSSMIAALNKAYQGLQPPTESQLLNILASMSGGLTNNQPADIVHAISVLKGRLSEANSQWKGYDQAQSAVNNSSTYLTSSVLSQINQHQTILTQLNDAITNLQPNIPASLGNPFGSSFQNYLATRQSQVSVAVYNANTGATYSFNSGLSFDTASIVKATIMATLLWQSQKSGTSLTSSEQSLMIPMIEDSSNSAATSLWDDAGRSAGIGAFLATAGMNQTVPGKQGYWGLTQTTALNQVALLKLLSYPNPILSSPSQSYANNLMTHVIGWEAWGVSSGVTPGTTVSLKNGWLPIGSQGWEINSIGHVMGSGRNYVVAILSRNNPSESYGIQTVDVISQYIWNSQ